MTALTTMFNAFLGWLLGLVVWFFSAETILDSDADFVPYALQIVNGLREYSPDWIDNFPQEFMFIFLIPVGIFVIGAIIGLVRRLIRG